MFSGHFGVAAGIKAIDVLTGRAPRAETEARRPDVPLWALMLSTQLLDVFFALLLIPKVESFGGATGYGQGWIHAYYSHSLVGALLIALAAGALASRWWGRHGGLLVGGTVFSHWLLDLIVHRPDLPLLPGNLGNLPFLGFGLWNAPAISIALEATLVVGGAALYLASAIARTGTPPQAGRGQAWLASGVMAALLALSLVASVLGIA
ncbi:MAG TPA: hypothetical protein VF807_12885 [Ktedonobacterales bacterium]